MTENTDMSAIRWSQSIKRILRGLFVCQLLVLGLLLAACTVSVPTAQTAVHPAQTATSTERTTASTTANTLSTTIAGGALRGVKIGIDPGHQRHANTAQEAVAPGSSQMKNKVTGGAVGVSTGIPEYVTVLEISQLLKTQLESAGATVYLTRETHDVDLSNQERAAMMNELQVDLMLRIHCDAAESAGANGIGLFVSESNAIAAQSRRYAEILQPILCACVGAKNRGITQNDNYTGQNWAEVPCIMIECGFLSNPTEDRLLNDTAYQNQLAAGICSGIIACFDRT